MAKVMSKEIVEIYYQAVLNKDVEVFWENREKVLCYKGKVIKEYFNERDFLKEYNNIKNNEKAVLKTGYAEFESKDFSFFKVIKTIKIKKSKV